MVQLEMVSQTQSVFEEELIVRFCAISVFVCFARFEKCP